MGGLNVIAWVFDALWGSRGNPHPKKRACHSKPGDEDNESYHERQTKWKSNSTIMLNDHRFKASTIMSYVVKGPVMIFSTGARRQ